jgi:hypothetical protein
MIRVMLTCDSRSLAAMCPYFEPPAHVKLEEVDGWIAATIEEHGWATRGDEHFCPQHNPTMVGRKVTVAKGNYTEVAPGVRVRLPDGHYGDATDIEVQTQYRECHGCVGEVCGGGNGVYEPGTEWGAWHKPDEKGR